MFISIIIPTYNKYQRLDMTLLSLALQTHSREDFEIVIVDDESKDMTKRIILNFQKQYPNINVNYVFQKNGGRACARNTGIKHAKGELIIFLDDDRMVVPEFIEEHVKSHIDSGIQDIAVLGTRMNLYMSKFEENYHGIKEQYIKEPECISKKAREEYYWRKVKRMINSKIAWITFATGNVSIRKSLLVDAGGFNERFVGWGLEDTELGYRLYERGITFLINEKAKNYHIEHVRKYSERQKEENNNHELFYSLHPELPVQLFRKFIYGEMSLEQFEECVNGEMLEGSASDKTFYYGLGDCFKD